MSTWPLVKFVDSPSTTATVRFDCNDLQAAAPRRVAAFDPGVPTLEGEPDAVGQQWGFRSPSLTVRVKGTKANALAALSALSKEQLRRTNWVMFQLSADTSPRWFRTYRTGYQPLSLDRVDVDKTSGLQGRTPDAWEIQVPLVADPFAYGAQVVIPTFQVIQGPADLTTPTRTAMRVVLPTIKGDAPAPLQVTVTPGSATGDASALSSWLIGCVAGTAAMADTVVDIGTGDAFTAGTGTSAGTAGANYFSGSYRTVTVSAAQALVTRLSGPFPNLPLGRYKVLVKVQADNATGIEKPYLFRLRMKATTSGTLFPAGTATKQAVAAAATFYGWIDLGEVALPPGVTSADEIPIGQLAPTPSLPPQMELEATTADGTTGTIRLDALKFIPITGPTVSQTRLLNSLFIDGYRPQQAAGPFIITGTFDGDSQTYWSTLSGPGVTTGVGPSTVRLSGGFPIADPKAAQNLLLVIALSAGTVIGGTGTTSITALNAQAAVDVSYFPRYLHLGDGT